MRILKRVLLGLLSIVIILLVIGLFTKKEYSVTRTVTISPTPTQTHTNTPTVTPTFTPTLAPDVFIDTPSQGAFSTPDRRRMFVDPQDAHLTGHPSKGYPTG